MWYMWGSLSLFPISQQGVLKSAALTDISFSLSVCLILLLLFFVWGNLFEHREARRLQSVRIHVHNFGVGDVLEQTHRGVLYVLSENCLDWLFLAGVHRRVLENASVTICALAWVLKEILAH